MKAHIMFLGVILNENKLKSRGLGSQNSNLDFLVCLITEKWHDDDTLSAKAGDLSLVLLKRILPRMTYHHKKKIKDRCTHAFLF